MNAIETLFNNLVATQKWECYTMHPDGFILEAGWAYTLYGTPYPPEVMAKAEAFNRAKMARLLDLAESSLAKSEMEFCTEAAAKGLA